MTRHVIGLAATVALIAGLLVYPFIPGSYDSLAIPLLTMAQVFGFVSLLLVPIGAVWLVYELRRRDPSQGARSAPAWSLRFAAASLGLSALVAGAVSLAALAMTGAALGIVVMTLWALAVVRGARRLRAAPAGEPRRSLVAPAYLVVVPVVSAALAFTLPGRAAEVSRTRVMEKGADLLRDIEQYHETHGRYPVSLVALWPDYKPGVVGVERYSYEPSGDSYNVFFEHWVDRIGTREIVMYNPRDEQEMTSHTMTRLRRTPAELAGRGGYYAAVDAGRPHWKRFWFD